MNSGSAAYFPCMRRAGCGRAAGHNGLCEPGCGTPGCTMVFAHRGICNVPTARHGGLHSGRPCTTPGCGLTLHHEVCVTRVDGGRRVSLTPGTGELTPFPQDVAAYPVISRPGLADVTVGAFLRAACTSPLGAMFGLALLALLWLAGCA